jgi:hypothetical protein
VIAMTFALVVFIAIEARSERKLSAKAERGLSISASVGLRLAPRAMTEPSDGIVPR